MAHVYLETSFFRFFTDLWVREGEAPAEPP